MIRKGAIRTAAIAVLLLLLVQVIGQLRSITSPGTDWGPLDFIRSHAWWYLSATIAALTVLTIANRFWMRTERSSGATQTPIATKPIASQSTNATAWNPSAVDSVETSIENEHLSEQYTTDKRSAEKPVVLYAVSRLLDEGGWEVRILPVLRSINNQALCAQLEERNLTIPGVAAIVVVFPAARLFPTKRATVAKLRMASTNYPSVRMLLFAAGLSDVLITPEEGRQLMKAAGCKDDHSRFFVCSSEDEYETILAIQLKHAIDVNDMQSTIDQSFPRAATDLETDS